jgi:hypothetical protein
MIATIREVRDELASALLPLASQGSPEWAVYSLLPASPEVPCIIVRFPDRITYNRTTAGHSELTFTIGAFHGINDPDAAQEALEALAGGALAEVLNSHTTSTWRALHVEDATNFRPEQIGEASCIAVDFTLTLIA